RIVILPASIAKFCALIITALEPRKAKSRFIEPRRSNQKRRRTTSACRNSFHTVSEFCHQLKPPATWKVSPVIQPESSDARKVATVATSCGCRIRPSGKRTDVDDAASGRGKLLDCFLRGKNQTQHIQIELLVEVFFGDLLKRSKFIDARVVYKDTGRTEAF